MDVFQDLIEELRDENLLEETVIDFDGLEGVSSPVRADRTMSDGDSTAADASSAPESESDFYRKRAIAEVSSLQMVEHVLSGIERQYLKIAPQAYDDLQTKKALHTFINVQGDSSSSEYAEAEFKLMRQIEEWSTALAQRDRKISPANLRRFCENSKPGLSSQALIALARFYRNTAYTDASRSKFDLIMTRLFAKDNGGEKRRLLFGKADMIGHIKTLYANWASVALYSTEDSAVQTRSVVAGFDDRVAEANGAQSFEELIRDGFFEKVRQFKEATGETFFTPEIVAAAIDCNVQVGNKFVDLVKLERERSTIERIEERYGFQYDQVISEAAAKTLELVELLKNLPHDEDGGSNAPREKVKVFAAPSVTKEKKASGGSSLFRVNKWLLLLTILVAVASASLYFWADSSGEETSNAETASDISFQGSPLSEYLKTGRASTENLYAITQPSWDQLPTEKKKEVLGQALEFANKNGKKTVSLLNNKGRTVGYASPTRSELLNPGP